MRMLKKIIIALIIVCFPILLNCLLRIPITNVIGGSDSDVIWLNFWADYGGAILGGFISLYIVVFERWIEFLARSVLGARLI